MQSSTKLEGCKQVLKSCGKGLKNLFRVRDKKHKNYKSEIKNKIFYIFISFSFVVMLVNCLITIFNLCDTQLGKWIASFARPLVFINSNIAVQTGADNSRDIFAHHMHELLVLKTLIEKTIDDYLIQPEEYLGLVEQHLKDLALGWQLTSHETGGYTEFFYYIEPTLRDESLFQSSVDIRASLEIPQFQDYVICFLVKRLMDEGMSTNFLKYSDFKRSTNYFGTVNGSFCNQGYQKSLDYLQDSQTSEDYKCEINQTGNYDPRCRPWYQEQKDSESSTITDMYGYADSNRVGVSQCVPLNLINQQDVKYYQEEKQKWLDSLPPEEDPLPSEEDGDQETTPDGAVDETGEADSNTTPVDESDETVIQNDETDDADQEQGSETSLDGDGQEKDMGDLDEDRDDQVAPLPLDEDGDGPIQDEEVPDEKISEETTEEVSNETSDEIIDSKTDSESSNQPAERRLQESQSFSESSRDFYGVLCLDYLNLPEIKNNPLMEQTQNTKGPPIFNKSFVFQLEDYMNQMIKLLEDNIIRTSVNDFTLEEKPIVSTIFKGFEINQGTFNISSEVNDKYYEENYLKIPGWSPTTAMQDFYQETMASDPEAFIKVDQFYTAENISATQNILFVYESIDLDSIDGLNATNQFEFFCFYDYQQVAGSFEYIKDHLFETVYKYWMPFFIFASCCYIVICYILIIIVSNSFTRPILKLTQRIKLNQQNVQRFWRLREISENASVIEKLYSNDDHMNIESMQVDLLSGFESVNQEMDKLQLTFNQMAKVMFVSRASSSKQFTIESIFDLLEAIKVFLNYNNLRGASTCYMMLGYNLATQLDSKFDLQQACDDFNEYAMTRTYASYLTHYLKSIKYMKRAEILQKSLINGQAAKELTKSTSIGSLRGSLSVASQDIGDKFILAFRLYTRAIISSQRFLQIEQDIRNKVMSLNDDSYQKYFDNMKYFDRIGLDAIEYFEKCLEALPKTSEAMYAHKKSQWDQTQRDSSSPFNDSSRGSKFMESANKPTQGDLNTPDAAELIMKAEQDEKRDFFQEVDDFLLSNGNEQQQNDGVEEVDLDKRPPQLPFDHHHNNLDIKHSLFRQNESDLSDIMVNVTNSKSKDESQILLNARGDNLSKQRNLDETNNFSTNMSQDSPEPKRNKQEPRKVNDHDGFLDFKLYVKLLILEIRILLFPLYFYQKNQMLKLDDSNNAQESISSLKSEITETINERLSRAGLNTPRNPNDRYESEEFDIHHPDLKDKDEDYDEDNPFREQSGFYDDKLTIYEKRIFSNLSYHFEGHNINQHSMSLQQSCVQRTNSKILNQSKVLQQSNNNNQGSSLHVISEDILDLERGELGSFQQESQKLERLICYIGWEVNEFEVEKMIVVKRHGLQVIEKWYLQQFHQYLQGLYNFVVLRQQKDSQEKALKHFINSLRVTNTVCNQTCKKTLSLMLIIMNNQLKVKFFNKVQEAQEADVMSQQAFYSGKKCQKDSYGRLSTINSMPGDDETNSIDKISKLELFGQNKMKDGKDVLGLRRSSKKTQLRRNASAVDERNKDKLNLFMEKNLSVQTRKSGGQILDFFIVDKKAQMEQGSRYTIKLNKGLSADNKHMKQESEESEESMEVDEELKDFCDQLDWVKIKLGHHIIQQQSIFFILDFNFDYYQQDQSCKEFIWETVQLMNEEDYFGMLSLDASKTEAICDLDKIGKNKILKFKMLDKVLLNTDQFDNHFSDSRISLRSGLESAFRQSSAIPTSSVKYLKTEYTQPLRWIVALLSSFSNYNNLNGLEINQQVNLILVFITNKKATDKQLENAKALIKGTASEGGILILRQSDSDTNFMNSAKQINALQEGLRKVQNIIKLYPSQNVPIIMEELNF